MGVFVLYARIFWGVTMVSNSQTAAGHGEDELNEYLTDMPFKSSKFKKRPTPPSPSTTYKAWKATAHRTRQHRRSRNNPYSILDCPWPFCRKPFQTRMQSSITTTLTTPLHRKPWLQKAATMPVLHRTAIRPQGVEGHERPPESGAQK